MTSAERTRDTRRRLVPETVQTSAMDCGAALPVYKQWTGSRCGVIDRALAAGVAPAAAGEDAGARASLPQRAIRSTCRWFAQSGADACSICPLIATDLTGSPPQHR
jgi:hypothetical protein